MKILMIGGTVFVGRATVEAALERGHEVTLFNRGRSNPGLFPQVEQLQGDRDGGLAALAGRRWDTVIDTSGYVPRVVRQSAEFLKEATAHYLFVSSLSVYANPGQFGIDEQGTVGKLQDETVEEITGETYGPLKVLCEQVVAQTLPGRALIIRPGLIVGPYDKTDRFTYWPWRVAQGGEVLAPGQPERPLQFIDVRDLAEWMVKMAEEQQTGVYNAIGPTPQPTIGELLQTCRSVSGSEATFVWVSEAFLAEHGVEPWTELPAWAPQAEPSMAGFFSFDNRKALAAGLTFRPLADTVHATLAWAATRPAEHEMRAGMSREREAALLVAWKHRD